MGYVQDMEVHIKTLLIYGLGVCDMKGGIAAIIDAIKELNLSELKKGIKLYFTYDEEIGFGGIYEIVEKGEKFPNIMIFGEPTDNEALLGSKGLLEYELNFIGLKAHSSNPEKGISANMNERIRFDTGPAAAESAISRRGFLKYLVFIGTGFAQPKRKKSIQRNPRGSRCFRGLSESLP